MPSAINIHFPEESSLPAEARAAFARGAGLWMSAGAASTGLWWENVPPHPDGRVGTIGAWSPGNETDTGNLIQRALGELADRGCGVVLAPMDGNTWRSYRFVTWSDGRPPFFLEPDSPADAARPFLAAGFDVLEHYSSGLVDLTAPGPDLTRIRAKLESRGATARPLAADEFVSALPRVHALSLAAFTNNVYYTPLDMARFAAMYEPLRDRIRDGLVWVAEDGNGLAAYLFALPDLRDADGRTVILKTLASRPDPALAGIGSVLTGLAHEAAAAMGFTTAIHALEHESNQSQRLSRRFGARVFRRYALLGRKTGSAATRIGLQDGSS